MALPVVLIGIGCALLGVAAWLFRMLYGDDD